MKKRFISVLMILVMLMLILPSVTALSPVPNCPSCGGDFTSGYCYPCRRIITDPNTPPPPIIMYEDFPNIPDFGKSMSGLDISAIEEDDEIVLYHYDVSFMNRRNLERNLVIYFNILERAGFKFENKEEMSEDTDILFYNNRTRRTSIAVIVNYPVNDINHVIIAIYKNEQESSPPAQSSTVIEIVIDSSVARVNGREVRLDQPATVINGRTMVPARFIAENLGATVDWDDASQTVTIRKGSTVIAIQIGNPTAYFNGKGTVLDQSAVILNGRTLVPARFIAESLGAKVEWDERTRTVTITSN